MIAIIGIIFIVGSFGAVAVPTIIEGTKLQTPEETRHSEVIRELKEIKNEKTTKRKPKNKNR